ncbi:MAG: hypothetical protein ACK418_21465 [Pseudomonas sp.]
MWLLRWSNFETGIEISMVFYGGGLLKKEKIPVLLAIADSFI